MNYARRVRVTDREIAKVKYFSKMSGIVKNLQTARFRKERAGNLNAKPMPDTVFEFIFYFGGFQEKDMTN